MKEIIYISLFKNLAFNLQCVQTVREPTVPEILHLASSLKRELSK